MIGEQETNNIIYREVRIFGYDNFNRFKNFRLDQSINDPHYLEIGDRFTGTSISQIMDMLKGHIDSSTKIGLFFHGYVTDGVHSIRFGDDEFKTTLPFIATIDSAFEMPLHFMIFTCFGGAVTGESENTLKNGTTVISYGRPDRESHPGAFAAQASALIHESHLAPHLMFNELIKLTGLPLTYYESTGDAAYFRFVYTPFKRAECVKKDMRSIPKEVQDAGFSSDGWGKVSINKKVNMAVLNTEGHCLMSSLIKEFQEEYTKNVNSNVDFSKLPEVTVLQASNAFVETAELLNEQCWWCTKEFIACNIDIISPTPITSDL